MQCSAQRQVLPMSYFHSVKRNPLTKMDLSLSCLFKILNSIDFDTDTGIQSKLDRLGLPEVLKNQIISLMYQLSEADLEEKMFLVSQGFTIPLYCLYWFLLFCKTKCEIHRYWSKVFLFSSASSSKLRKVITIKSYKLFLTLGLW